MDEETIVDKRFIIRKKSSKRYINGVDLHNSLVQFYNDLDQIDEDQRFDYPIPSYIGECILKIAEKLATKIYFSGYSFKEDMIGDAIEKMVEAVRLRKYDPNESNNPFAYFSQISWNSYLQRIEKEKRQTYIKHKQFEQLWFEDRAEIEKLFNDEAHQKVINDFENPTPRSSGYTPHRNLSYEKNRARKGIKKNNEKSA